MYPEPLLNAVKSSDPHRVKAAIRRGDKVNGQEVCLLAVALSAHVRFKDLDYARGANNAYDVFELLVKAGARTNRVLAYGQTLLFEVVQLRHDTGMALCELLLKHGANPNFITATGYTPLHAAAECNNMAAIALLFVFGARQQPEQETPLDRALTKNHLPVASWLAHEKQCCPVFAAIRYDLDEQLFFVLRNGIIDPESVCCYDELRRQRHHLHALTRIAFASWSPKRHWQFHLGVRAAVVTLLLIAQRVPDLAPHEIWILVCKHFRRRHFAVLS